MLNRKQYSKLKIEDINIAITVHQRMIDWYHDYINIKGGSDYIDSRITSLYNSLAEYLIARDIHIED